ncbi:MAG: hypothetical protein R3D05_12595 [Dongiaceae bacterium]
MAQRHEGLPATSLFLFATALLLFGVGGGLMGYMVGDRHGERHAIAIVGAVGTYWDAHRADAKSSFDGAIDNAATLLDKAASDLKAEVSMYHGCGAICDSIANQFAAEVLHARDLIRNVELAPLADWKGALDKSGVPLAADTGITNADLKSGVSGTMAIGAIALLCATVALCFGIACATVVKLRAREIDSI